MTQSELFSQFWKRSVSLGVALSFLVTSVITNPGVGYGQTAGIDFARIFSAPVDRMAGLAGLPAEIGSVVETSIRQTLDHRPQTTEKNASPADRGPRTEDSLVILLQDAHANPTAQENIRQILRYLSGKYKNMTVAVEGSSGQLRPDYFDVIKNHPKAGEAILRDLSAKGEITGAELFAFEEAKKYAVRGTAYGENESGGRLTEYGVKDLNPVRGTPSAVRVMGVENTALYREDLELFRSVQKDFPSITKALLPVHAALDQEASRVLSPELRDFLKERERRKNGKFTASQTAGDPNIAAYSNYLAKQSNKVLAIDLSDAFEQLRYPNLMRLLALQKDKEITDPEAVTAAWEKFMIDLGNKISQEKEFLSALRYFAVTNGLVQSKRPAGELPFLYSKELLPRKLLEYLYHLKTSAGIRMEDYPVVLKSFRSLILRCEIDAAGLFEEMDSLEGLITAKLAVSDAEKALVKRFAFLERLEKALRLELDRKEYRALVAEKASLQEFTKASDLLAASLDRALKFYELAEKRDSVLLENALELEAEGVRRTADDGKSGLAPSALHLPLSEVIVLITGGFHTDGIKAILEEKGIQHAVVMPRITSTDHGEAYLKTMNGSNSDLSAYFNVANPFRTKQQAIIFKGIIENAAPSLVQDENLSVSQAANLVQDALTNHPLLANALRAEFAPVILSGAKDLSRDSSAGEPQNDELIHTLIITPVQFRPTLSGNSAIPAELLFSPDYESTVSTAPFSAAEVTMMPAGNIVRPVALSSKKVSLKSTRAETRSFKKADRSEKRDEPWFRAKRPLRDGAIAAAMIGASILLVLAHPGWYFVVRNGLGQLVGHLASSLLDKKFNLQRYFRAAAFGAGWALIIPLYAFWIPTLRIAPVAGAQLDLFGFAQIGVLAGFTILGEIFLPARDGEGTLGRFWRTLKFQTKNIIYAEGGFFIKQITYWTALSGLYYASVISFPAFSQLIVIAAMIFALPQALESVLTDQVKIGEVPARGKWQGLFLKYWPWFPAVFVLMSGLFNIIPLTSAVFLFGSAVVSHHLAKLVVVLKEKVFPHDEEPVLGAGNPAVAPEGMNLHYDASKKVWKGSEITWPSDAGKALRVHGLSWKRDREDPIQKVIAGLPPVNYWDPVSGEIQTEEAAIFFRRYRTRATWVVPEEEREAAFRLAALSGEEFRRDAVVRAAISSFRAYLPVRGVNELDRLLADLQDPAKVREVLTAPFMAEDMTRQLLFQAQKFGLGPIKSEAKNLKKYVLARLVLQEILHRLSLSDDLLPDASSLRRSGLNLTYNPEQDEQRSYIEARRESCLADLHELAHDLMLHSGTFTFAARVNVSGIEADYGPALAEELRSKINLIDDLEIPAEPLTAEMLQTAQESYRTFLVTLGEMREIMVRHQRSTGPDAPAESFSYQNLMDSLTHYESLIQEAMFPAIDHWLENLRTQEASQAAAKRNSEVKRLQLLPGFLAPGASSSAAQGGKRAETRRKPKDGLRGPKENLNSGIVRRLPVWVVGSLFGAMEGLYWLLNQAIFNLYAFIQLPYEDYTATIAYLVGPVIEEIKDRLILFKYGFMPRMSSTAAVLSSSAVFSVLHVLTYWAEDPILFAPRLIASFVAGVSLAASYRISGTLLVPIALHMIHNAKVDASNPLLWVWDALFMMISVFYVFREAFTPALQKQLVSPKVPTWRKLLVIRLLGATETKEAETALENFIAAKPSPSPDLSKAARRAIDQMNPRSLQASEKKNPVGRAETRIRGVIEGIQAMGDVRALAYLSSAIEGVQTLNDIQDPEVMDALKNAFQTGEIGEIENQVQKVRWWKIGTKNSFWKCARTIRDKLNELLNPQWSRFMLAVDQIDRKDVCQLVYKIMSGTDEPSFSSAEQALLESHHAIIDVFRDYPRLARLLGNLPPGLIIPEALSRRLNEVLNRLRSKELEFNFQRMRATFDAMLAAGRVIDGIDREPTLGFVIRIVRGEVNAGDILSHNERESLAEIEMLTGAAGLAEVIAAIGTDPTLIQKVEMRRSLLRMNQEIDRTMRELQTKFEHATGPEQERLRLLLEVAAKLGENKRQFLEELGEGKTNQFRTEMRSTLKFLVASAVDGMIWVGTLISFKRHYEAGVSNPPAVATAPSFRPASFDDPIYVVPSEKALRSKDILTQFIGDPRGVARIREMDEIVRREFAKEAGSLDAYIQFAKSGEERPLVVQQALWLASKMDPVWLKWLKERNTSIYSTDTPDYGYTRGSRFSGYFGEPRIRVSNEIKSPTQLAIVLAGHEGKHANRLPRDLRGAIWNSHIMLENLFRITKLNTEEVAAFNSARIFTNALLNVTPEPPNIGFNDASKLTYSYRDAGWAFALDGIITVGWYAVGLTFWGIGLRSMIRKDRQRAEWKKYGRYGPRPGQTHTRSGYGRAENRNTAGSVDGPVDWTPGLNLAILEYFGPRWLPVENRTSENLKNRQRIARLIIATSLNKRDYLTDDFEFVAPREVVVAEMEGFLDHMHANMRPLIAGLEDQYGAIADELERIVTASRPDVRDPEHAGFLLRSPGEFDLPARVETLTDAATGAREPEVGISGTSENTGNDRAETPKTEEERIDFQDLGNVLTAFFSPERVEGYFDRYDIIRIISAFVMSLGSFYYMDKSNIAAVVAMATLWNVLILIRSIITESVPPLLKKKGWSFSQMRWAKFTAQMFSSDISIITLVFSMFVNNHILSFFDMAKTSPGGLVVSGFVIGTMNGLHDAFFRVIQGDSRRTVILDFFRDYVMYTVPMLFVNILPFLSKPFFYSVFAKVIGETWAGMAEWQSESYLPVVAGATMEEMRKMLRQLPRWRWDDGDKPPCQRSLTLEDTTMIVRVSNKDEEGWAIQFRKIAEEGNEMLTLTWRPNEGLRVGRKIVEGLDPSKNPLASFSYGDDPEKPRNLRLVFSNGQGFTISQVSSAPRESGPAGFILENFLLSEVQLAVERAEVRDGVGSGAEIDRTGMRLTPRTLLASNGLMSAVAKHLAALPETDLNGILKTQGVKFPTGVRGRLLDTFQESGFKQALLGEFSRTMMAGGVVLVEADAGSLRRLTKNDKEFELVWTGEDGKIHVLERFYEYLNQITNEKERISVAAALFARQIAARLFLRILSQEDPQANTNPVLAPKILLSARAVEDFVFNSAPQKLEESQVDLRARGFIHQQMWERHEPMARHAAPRIDWGPNERRMKGLLNRLELMRDKLVTAGKVTPADRKEIDDIDASFTLTLSKKTADEIARKVRAATAVEIEAQRERLLRAYGVMQGRIVAAAKNLEERIISEKAYQETTSKANAQANGILNRLIKADLALIRAQLEMRVSFRNSLNDLINHFEEKVHELQWRSVHDQAQNEIKEVFVRGAASDDYLKVRMLKDVIDRQRRTGVTEHKESRWNHEETYYLATIKQLVVALADEEAAVTVNPKARRAWLLSYLRMRKVDFGGKADDAVMLDDIAAAIYLRQDIADAVMNKVGKWAHSRPAAGLDDAALRERELIAELIPEPDDVRPVERLKRIRYANLFNFLRSRDHVLETYDREERNAWQAIGFWNDIAYQLRNAKSDAMTASRLRNIRWDLAPIEEWVAHARVDEKTRIRELVAKARDNVKLGQFDIVLDAAAEAQTILQNDFIERIRRMSRYVGQHKQSIMAELDTGMKLIRSGIRENRRRDFGKALTRFRNFKARYLDGAKSTSEEPGYIRAKKNLTMAIAELAAAHQLNYVPAEDRLLIILKCLYRVWYGVEHKYETIPEMGPEADEIEAEVTARARQDLALRAEMRKVEFLGADHPIVRDLSAATTGAEVRKILPRLIPEAAERKAYLAFRVISRNAEKDEALEALGFWTDVSRSDAIDAFEASIPQKLGKPGSIKGIVCYPGNRTVAIEFRNGDSVVLGVKSGFYGSTKFENNIRGNPSASDIAAFPKILQGYLQNGNLTVRGVKADLPLEYLLPTTIQVEKLAQSLPDLEGVVVSDSAYQQYKEVQQKAAAAKEAKRVRDAIQAESAKAAEKVKLKDAEEKRLAKVALEQAQRAKWKTWIARWSLRVGVSVGLGIGCLVGYKILDLLKLDRQSRAARIIKQDVTSLDTDLVEYFGYYPSLEIPFQKNLARYEEALSHASLSQAEAMEKATGDYDLAAALAGIEKQQQALAAIPSDVFDWRAGYRQYLNLVYDLATKDIERRWKAAVKAGILAEADHRSLSVSLRELVKNSIQAEIGIAESQKLPVRPIAFMAGLLQRPHPIVEQLQHLKLKNDRPEKDLTVIASASVTLPYSLYARMVKYAVHQGGTAAVFLDATPFPGKPEILTMINPGGNTIDGKITGGNITVWYRGKPVGSAQASRRNFDIEGQKIHLLSAEGQPVRTIDVSKFPGLPRNELRVAVPAQASGRIWRLGMADVRSLPGAKTVDRLKNLEDTEARSLYTNLPEMLLSDDGKLEIAEESFNRGMEILQEKIRRLNATIKLIERNEPGSDLKDILGTHRDALVELDKILQKDPQAIVQRMANENIRFSVVFLEEGILKDGRRVNYGSEIVLGKLRKGLAMAQTMLAQAIEGLELNAFVEKVLGLPRREQSDFMAKSDELKRLDEDVAETVKAAIIQVSMFRKNVSDAEEFDAVMKEILVKIQTEGTPEDSEADGHAKFLDYMLFPEQVPSPEQYLAERRAHGKLLKAVVLVGEGLNATGHLAIVIGSDNEPPILVSITPENMKEVKKAIAESGAGGQVPILIRPAEAGSERSVKEEGAAGVAIELIVNPSADELAEYRRQEWIQSLWPKALARFSRGITHSVKLNMLPGQESDPDHDVGLYRTEIMTAERLQIYFDLFKIKTAELNDPKGGRDVGANLKDALWRRLYEDMEDEMRHIAEDPTLAGKRFRMRPEDRRSDKNSEYYVEMEMNGIPNDAEGQDHYRTPLGRIELTFRLMATLTAEAMAAKSGKPHAKFEVIYPGVRGPEDLDFIENEILPEARKFAAQRVAELSGETVEASARAIAAAEANIRFGMMIELSEAAVENRQALLTRPGYLDFSVGSNDLETSLADKASQAKGGPRITRDSPEISQAKGIIGEDMREIVTGWASDIDRMNREAAPGQEKTLSICGEKAADKEGRNFFGPFFNDLVQRFPRANLSRSMSVGSIPYTATLENLLRMPQYSGIGSVYSQPRQTELPLETGATEEAPEVEAGREVEALMQNLRPVMLVLEQYQSRYEREGFYDALHLLKINMRDGIGGLAEFQYLDRMLTAVSKEDKKPSADELYVDPDQRMNAAGLRTLLKKLKTHVKSGSISAEDIDLLEEAFKFMTSLQESFETASKKDPELFGHSLNLHNMEEFLKVYPLASGDPTRQAYDLISQYQAYAEKVFTITARFLFTVSQEKFPPEIASEKDLGVAMSDQSGKVFFMEQERKGISFYLGEGFVYGIGRYLEVKNARAWLEANPERLLEIFRVAAQRGLRISQSTQQAIEGFLASQGPIVPDEVQRAWMKDFDHILKSPGNAEYALIRMARLGVLSTLFPESVASRGVRAREGNHFDLFSDALRNWEMLGALPSQKNPVYSLAQETLHQEGTSPTGLSDLRLAFFLPSLTRGWDLNSSPASRLALVRSVLRPYANATEMKLKDFVGWTARLVRLLDKQASLLQHDFLTDAEVSRALEHLTKGMERSDMELLRQIYLMAFVARAGLPDSVDRGMGERQGLDSPLADLDTMSLAAQLLIAEEPVRAAASARIAEAEAVARQQMRDVAVESGSARLQAFERIRSGVLSDLANTGAMSRTLNAYLKVNRVLPDFRKKAVENVDLKIKKKLGVLADGTLDRDVATAFFDRYAQRVSKYYVASVDEATVIQDLLMLAHLESVHEEEGLEPAVSFRALPHHHQQAFEITFGFPMASPSALAVFLGILANRGFSITNGRLYPSGDENAPVIMKFSGVFEQGHVDAQAMRMQIATDVQSILEPETLPKKRATFFGRARDILSVFFLGERKNRFNRLADRFPEGFTVQSLKAEWEKAETQVERLPRDPSKNFTTFVISTDMRRGPFYLVATLLANTRVLVTGFEYDTMNGRRSRLRLDLTHSGLPLRQDMEEGIEQDLKRYLGMEFVRVKGDEIVPVKRSEGRLEFWSFGDYEKALKGIPVANRKAFDDFHNEVTRFLGSHGEYVTQANLNRVIGIVRDPDQPEIVRYTAARLLRHFPKFDSSLVNEKNRKNASGLLSDRDSLGLAGSSYRFEMEFNAFLLQSGGTIDGGWLLGGGVSAPSAPVSNTASLPGKRTEMRKDFDQAALDEFLSALNYTLTGNIRLRKRATVSSSIVVSPSTLRFPNPAEVNMTVSIKESGEGAILPQAEKEYFRDYLNSTFRRSYVEAFALDGYAQYTLSSYDLSETDQSVQVKIKFQLRAGPVHEPRTDSGEADVLRFEARAATMDALKDMLHEPERMPGWNWVGRGKVQRFIKVGPSVGIVRVTEDSWGIDISEPARGADRLTITWSEEEGLCVGRQEIKGFRGKGKSPLVSFSYAENDTYPQDFSIAFTPEVYTKDTEGLLPEDNHASTTRGVGPMGYTFKGRSEHRHFPEAVAVDDEKAAEIAAVVATYFPPELPKVKVLTKQNASQYLRYFSTLVIRIRSSGILDALPDQIWVKDTGDLLPRMIEKKTWFNRHEFGNFATVVGAVSSAETDYPSVAEYLAEVELKKKRPEEIRKARDSYDLGRIRNADEVLGIFAELCRDHFDLFEDKWKETKADGSLKYEATEDSPIPYQWIVPYMVHRSFGKGGREIREAVFREAVRRTEKIWPQVRKYTQKIFTEIQAEWDDAVLRLDLPAAAPVETAPVQPVPELVQGDLFRGELRGSTAQVKTALEKLFDRSEKRNLVPEWVPQENIQAIEGAAAEADHFYSVPGLEVLMEPDRRFAARLWIADRLIKAFETQQPKPGTIENAALRTVIDSLKRFQLTGTADSVLETKGIHVSLPVLMPEQYQELAELAPVFLAFAVSLNAKLYLNVKGQDPEKLKTLFLSAATRNGIEAKAFLEIVAVRGSQAFTSAKEGRKRDALLASQVGDLPEQDKEATLWFNSTEASRDMKVLAAEITEALYAALDPKIPRNKPTNIAEHFGELTTAIMNAIQASLKILVAA